jgi:hypothetical protein
MKAIVTAAGRNQLKAMTLAKLKRYINAYNIRIDRAVEKDDLIDAIIMARVSSLVGYKLQNLSSAIGLRARMDVFPALTK